MARNARIVMWVVAAIAVLVVGVGLFLSSEPEPQYKPMQGTVGVVDHGNGVLEPVSVRPTTRGANP